MSPGRERLGLRVGAMQTVAAGNIGVLSYPLQYGGNLLRNVVMNGTIGEVIVYNSLLSPGDRSTLSAYLRGRFPSAI